MTSLRTRDANDVRCSALQLANKLFGVTIEAADGQVPVWHESVRFFKVSDSDGKPKAYFYLGIRCLRTFSALSDTL